MHGTIPRSMRHAPMLAVRGRRLLQFVPLCAVQYATGPRIDDLGWNEPFPEALRRPAFLKHFPFASSIIEIDFNRYLARPRVAVAVEDRPISKAHADEIETYDARELSVKPSNMMRAAAATEAQTMDSRPFVDFS